jgi:hypothetical protein
MSLKKKGKKITKSLLVTISYARKNNKTHFFNAVIGF